MNDILSKLEPFMYSTSIMSIESSNVVSDKKDSKSSIDTKKNTQKPHKDTLWGCFRLLGVTGAEMSSIKAFQDRQLKMQYIEKFRNPQVTAELFKSRSKICTFADVDADLSINKCIHLPTFIALCMLEKVAPFIIIYKNTYYQFGNGGLESPSAAAATAATAVPMRVIKYESEPYPQWRYNEWSNADYIAFTRSAMKLDNIIKPYRAISSYKLDELRNIVKQIAPPAIAHMHKSKPELYEMIKEYFTDLR